MVCVLAAQRARGKPKASVRCAGVRPRRALRSHSRDIRTLSVAALRTPAVPSLVFTAAMFIHFCSSSDRRSMTNFSCIGGNPLIGLPSAVFVLTVRRIIIPAHLMRKSAITFAVTDSSSEGRMESCCRACSESGCSIAFAAFVRSRRSRVAAAFSAFRWLSNSPS